MNPYEDVFFYALGFLTAVLLVVARYRYCAAVATRLMGKEEKETKPFFTEDHRTAITIISIISVVIIVVAVCLYKYHTETSRQEQELSKKLAEAGYQFIPTPGWSRQKNSMQSVP